MEIVLYKDGCFGPSEYICKKLQTVCMELEPCGACDCGFCFDRTDKDLIAFVKQANGIGDNSAYIVNLPDTTTDYDIVCRGDYDDSEYIIYASNGKINYYY